MGRRPGEAKRRTGGEEWDQKGGGGPMWGRYEEDQTRKKNSSLLLSFHVFLSNISPWLSHIHYVYKVLHYSLQPIVVVDPIVDPLYSPLIVGLCCPK